MPYTTATKLLDQFGDTEVALQAASEFPNVDGVLLRLTVTGGDRSAYSAQDIADADQTQVRLNAVIDSAGRLIDSYLSPRYSLPLDQAFIDQSSLPEFCNDIVRYKLMDDLATEEVDNRYKEALRWLRDVSMNKASLGEQDTATATAEGRMISRPGNSKTDWETY